MFKITIGQITDKGLNPKRPMNEDKLLTLTKQGLFLVADGVGGRRGGEVASQVVVDVFTRVFSQDQPDDLQTVITGTIDLCNQKIYEEAGTNPELEGMATTIALVALDDRNAVVAHVGDSRVYRFDERGLVCLTEDHSEVNEALRSGIITEDQAATYPRRNVINRALGAEQYVESDIIEVETNERTSFLLCSDGITRHISDDEIARLMKSDRHPQSICETMKELCYAGGAEDNLTAVIVHLGERNYVEEPTKPARAARAKAAPASGVAVPRPSRRIEVDLGGAQSVGKGAERSSQPSFLARFQSGTGEAKQTTAARNQGVQGKNLSRGLPEKGELSTVMKWSLLILALIAGVVIGLLFGAPIQGQFNKLFGGPDPYSQRGIKDPPSNAEVKASYARFLEGRTDEARQRLNKILTEDPNNAEAHFYLGRIDIAENQYDDAINHLTQALTLDPSLPDIRVYLAMAYLSIGQQRNAKDILQQIVSPSLPSSATSPSASPGATQGTSKPVG